MDQPIVARFRYTVDELLVAYRYHARHNCRWPFRIALYLVFALALLGGITALWQERSLTFSGTLLVLAGLYWFAIRPLERRWQLVRRFKADPNLSVESEWSFAPDKVRVHCRLGSSDLNWDAFIKVVTAPKGLLLYQSDDLYYWIPRSGFAHAADFHAAEQLAASKIKKSERVT